MPNNTQNNIDRPGFIVRLMVVVYDLLLLAGVLFASYAIIFALFLTLPDAINKLYIIKLFKFSLLIVLAFLFYAWFWVNGGQTLGMKAWHLYLVNDDGKFLDWNKCAIRFLVAALSWAACGLGFIWIMFNRKKLAWHDIASKSQIVRSKPEKKK